MRFNPSHADSWGFINVLAPKGIELYLRASCLNETTSFGGQGKEINEQVGGEESEIQGLHGRDSPEISLFGLS